MITHNQLHYYKTISMKVTIFITVRPTCVFTVKRKQSLISAILLNRDILQMLTIMKQIWTQMNGYFLEMNSKRYTELKKLPPYSPFPNIVEQSISRLKAAIKGDISRPEVQQQTNNREGARRQLKGSHWGVIELQL